MVDFLWNLGAFIVALGILVTIHEYGHFWVARRNGVYVERFSIGFGKALWRWHDKLGTEYVIAAIPLGGYVKMLDERVTKVSAEDRHKTFNSKTVLQRISIVAAGPMANFLLAIVAFYLMFLIGVPSVKPIIGELTSNSIAAQAQLPNRAEIIAVNGQRTLDWQDVNMALVASIGQPQIDLKLKQSGRQYVNHYTLDTKHWSFSPDKISAMTSLGIAPYRPIIHSVISVVQPKSAAEQAGLQVGDKLVKINGIDITEQWKKFADIIRQSPEQNVDLVIERDGHQQSLVLKPALKRFNNENIGYLGIVPKQDAYPSVYQFNLRYGPVDAIGQSVARTWRLVTLSFDMIGKLITGKVSVHNLSGPIAIAQGAGNSAGYGFVYFLGFLALISVNLGIINLLPLPVLDGGHILYYFIELLTGKTVPEKVQEIGFRIGAIALLGLMSIAIFNDLSRL